MQYHSQNQTDRQTTSFIESSTEAGILLGGNGAPRAMSVSLTLSRSQFDSVFLIFHLDPLTLPIPSAIHSALPLNHPL